MSDVNILPDHCIRVQEINKIQAKIFARHIDEHKHCRHIKDINQAYYDMIHEYGWIAKEAICQMCKGCKDWDQRHHSY